MFSQTLKTIEPKKKKKKQEDKQLSSEYCVINNKTIKKV
jgi:hypothetical protein